MQINKRQEDLSKVFDRTWKANHSDDIKKEKARKKSFIDKMFDIKDIQEENDSKLRPLSESEKLKNRQDNMNGIKELNDRAKLNDIKGKFN